MKTIKGSLHKAIDLLWHSKRSDYDIYHPYWGRVSNLIFISVEGGSFITIHYENGHYAPMQSINKKLILVKLGE